MEDDEIERANRLLDFQWIQRRIDAWEIENAIGLHAHGLEMCEKVEADYERFLR